MTKPSWQEILEKPCYLLNMKRCKDRFRLSRQRIARAGFKDIHRVEAIDASAALENDFDWYWGQHGSPPFDPKDKDFAFFKGKQACALGHYQIWKDIIARQLDYAIVFEDDVQFHRGWKELAPLYWEQTPTYFDMLFMGCQFTSAPLEEDAWVVEHPSYCTHAYIITYHGASILYDLCVNNPFGTRTLDCILFDAMDSSQWYRDYLFQWYCWDGRDFPDKNALKDIVWKKRNCGLVFQDARFQSLIKEDYVE